MFRDLVRKQGAGNKIRAEHTWWPSHSKPVKQFTKFPSSVLLSHQLGVSETDLQKALCCSSVTEKRITTVDGFSVRKFHNVEFLTVLELASHILTLNHDIVPCHNTIAQQDCSEVNRLRQSITRCGTRSEVSTQEKLDDTSANVQKRRRQEDGSVDDAGETSKEQNRKETLQKHLKTMTLDETATFVDQVFATIEIVCGMIDPSRAAMVRSSIEPIVIHFNCDTIIDLTMLAPDEDETPTAPKRSRFHQQELPLPDGATAEGSTVKTPNNCSNTLLTASDAARCRKERKIVASLDKLLSRDKSQPTQQSQRHQGFSA
jgi:hypothetical protein